MHVRRTDDNRIVYDFGDDLLPCLRLTYNTIVSHSMGLMTSETLHSCSIDADLILHLFKGLPAFVHKYISGRTIEGRYEFDFIRKYTIGKRIHVMRQRLGMSQKELASCVGLTVGTIAKYETDQHIPSVQTLVKIAYALGVSITLLATGLCQEPK